MTLVLLAYLEGLLKALSDSWSELLGALVLPGPRIMNKRGYAGLRKDHCMLLRSDSYGPANNFPTSDFFLG